MVSAKSHKTMVRRLKKQVTAWKRKEKAARNKLRSIMSKVKKMARAYNSKLNKKFKEAKAKIAAAESAVYIKLSKTIKQKAKKVRKGKKGKVSAAAMPHPKPHGKRKAAHKRRGRK